MKKYYIATIVSIMAVSISAQAERIAPSNIECDAALQQCTATVELDPGMVTWYLTSQGDENPGLKVNYINSLGELIDVIKTSVYSEDLSNKSTGTFEVTEPGDYQLVFTDIMDLREDIAGIFYRSTPVSITYQFAGDAGSNRAFRDVYGSLTWMKRK